MNIRNNYFPNVCSSIPAQEKSFPEKRKEISGVPHGGVPRFAVVALGPILSSSAVEPGLSSSAVPAPARGELPDSAGISAAGAVAAGAAFIPA